MGDVLRTAANTTHQNGEEPNLSAKWKRMKLAFFVVESVGNFRPNGWYQFKMDSPKHVNTKDVARLKANSLLWLLTNDIPGRFRFHFFGNPNRENQAARLRKRTKRPATGSRSQATYQQSLVKSCCLATCCFSMVFWLQKCQSQKSKEKKNTLFGGSNRLWLL